MLSTFRIAAVSAVLSGLVVGIWDADARTPADSAKTFVDRVPETAVEASTATSLISAEQRRPTQSAGRKGDRSASAGVAGCDEAAWPYVPQACLHFAGGAEPRTSVRTITVETRQGDNTSILMRMPQTTVAAR